MRNIFLTVVVFCAAGMLASCKKDSNKAEEPESGPRIKRMVWVYPNDSSVTEYKYDEKGRIREVAEGGYTNFYTYPTGRAEFRQVLNGKTDTFTAIFLLNSKGLADSMYSINSDHSIEAGYSMEYDAEGYMIRNEDGIMHIENGNLVLAETLGSPGAPKSVFTYTDKLNTIGSENTGMLFLGKQSKNLQSKYTYSGGTENYSYTFDSEGRVAKMLVDVTTGSTQYSYEYHYTYY